MRSLLNVRHKIRKERAAAERNTIVAFKFTAANKQMVLRAAEPSSAFGKCPAFDASVGVFASLAAVMSAIAGHFTICGTLYAISKAIAGSAALHE